MPGKIYEEYSCRSRKKIPPHLERKDPPGTDKVRLSATLLFW